MHRFRYCFFAIQALLIWHSPNGFANVPKDPSHFEKLSNSNPKQSLYSTTSMENQLVHPHYIYESMHDLMKFGGSDYTARTPSPPCQNPWGQPSSAFGGPEFYVDRSLSVAESSGPLTRGSFSGPLTRYIWDKANGINIGIIHPSREPDTLEPIQLPTFPVANYPPMARLDVPSKEDLEAYMKEFHAGLEEFTRNIGIFRGTKKKKRKRFGSLRICWTEVQMDPRIRRSTCYIIRLEDSDGTGRPYQAFHNVERLFKSLLKRLLYVHAHFLYHSRKDQNFALKRQAEFVKWLYKVIFQPSVGLPILGMVKSLPPKRERNESAFGPVQRLIIKHFEKMTGVDDKKYFYTACKIVGLWYKNFDKWQMWRFSDDQFWKFMFSNFDTRDPALQGYIIQKEAQMVGVMA